jgi:hypothetical protein
MGSLTDYSELELLDHVFNAAYTPVATVYLALATADPTDAATGASMNEVPNSGSYARTAITFAAAASRRVTQTGAVTFPAATGAWGTVTHWSVVDNATHGAGNVLAHGAFGASKAIVSGNTPSVADAEVYVEILAEISTYLANKLLDLMFRNVAYTKPSTYVALSTTTIDESDDGSTLGEPGSGAYAREQVNVNGGASPTWDLAAAGVVDNTHDIDLGPASGAAWGTITSVATVDSVTTGAGNVLFYDNDMADQAVGDGDTARFTAGSLDIGLS